MKKKLVTIEHLTKFPVLVPRDHYLAQLQILESHEHVHHQRVKATLTDLRARFWIPRGRQLVRRILYRCMTCRRYEGRHYAVPPQADLPCFRVTNPAWDSVGVDYAGPLFVKSYKMSLQRLTSFYTLVVAVGQFIWS